MEWMVKKITLMIWQNARERNKRKKHGEITQRNENKGLTTGYFNPKRGQEEMKERKYSKIKLVFRENRPKVILRVCRISANAQTQPVNNKCSKTTEGNKSYKKKQEWKK